MDAPADDHTIIPAECDKPQRKLRERLVKHGYWIYRMVCNLLTIGTIIDFNHTRWSEICVDTG